MNISLKINELYDREIMQLNRQSRSLSGDLLVLRKCHVVGCVQGKQCYSFDFDAQVRMRFSFSRHMLSLHHRFLTTDNAFREYYTSS